MNILIKVDIDKNHQWSEANKLFDLLKDYRPDLIPFPMRRKNMVEWLDDDRQITTHELTEYDKGWNDCVDYLEGKGI